MGTDIDFELELRKNSLVSRQFEQPLTELDSLTEPTEQPNAEFIFNIIRILQMQLGHRLDQGNHGPILVTVNFGENQRLLIAFGNRPRSRVQEPVHERPFQRIMREIVQSQNNRIEDEFEPRRQAVRFPMDEIPEELENERIEEVPEIIPEVEYEERDWEMGMEIPQEQRQDEWSREEIRVEEETRTIFSREIEQMELRHSQGVFQNKRGQEEQLEREFQKCFESKLCQEPKEKSMKMTEEFELSPNPESKQELYEQFQKNPNKVENSLEAFNTMDQSIMPLKDEIKKNSIPKVEQEEKIEQEEEIGCWKAFMRMIRNTFRVIPL